MRTLEHISAMRSAVGAAEDRQRRIAAEAAVKARQEELAQQGADALDRQLGTDGRRRRVGPSPAELVEERRLDERRLQDRRFWAQRSGEEAAARVFGPDRPRNEQELKHAAYSRWFGASEADKRFPVSPSGPTSAERAAVARDYFGRRHGG